VTVRYQKVAGALRGWSPELEQAQRMSVQALDQAEIPYARLRQQAIVPSGSRLRPVLRPRRLHFRGRRATKGNREMRQLRDQAIAKAHTAAQARRSRS
jgi:hypothetical protein